MEVLQKRKGGAVRWYLLGTLVALELLMSFSFLGYFHMEPISITTAYLPVLLAGAVLGPLDALTVGTVFGLASMWKASASYTMAFDQLFSPIMSGSPVGSIFLSVVSRALFGLLTGLLYAAARRARHPAVWVGVITYFGRHIHSALVYSMMWLFFPETGYTPADSFQTLLSWDGVLSNLLQAGLILLLWSLMRTKTWGKFVQRVEGAQVAQMSERYHVLSLVGMILLAFFSSVAVALYFVHRMSSALSQKGISIPEDGYADLVHLQIQFLFGILAMMALVIIFLIFNRRYTTYINREARMDALTGVLTRKAFFPACEKLLKRFDGAEGAAGYFLMVDLDRFKEINDLYGHPEGDRALKEAATAMKLLFGKDSLIGRMGGDEFALLVYVPVSRMEIEDRMRQLIDCIERIHIGDSHMSCSIGAQPVLRPGPAEALYREADGLLYQAKNRGKRQYVVGPEGERACGAPESPRKERVKDPP